MKKYMFILAAALFSLTLNAQRPERKVTPKSTDTKKSEATVQRPKAESPKTTTRSESSTRSTVTRTTSDNRGSDNSSGNTNRTTVTRTTSDSPKTDNRNENAERSNIQRTTTANPGTTTRTENPVRSTEVRTTQTENRDRNENSVRSDNSPDRTNEVTRTQNNSAGGTEGRTEVSVARTRTNTDAQPSRRENSISGSGDNSTDRKYEEQRRTYSTPHRTVVHHENVYVSRPQSIEYRREHYAYRAPSSIHVVWTNRMYHDYLIMYPEYNYWYYPIGYNIYTISAYDAVYYIGEVRNIYGRVHQAWFSWETDEYFLYFGAPYPYQDFTVIIPGRKARQFSNRPEIFFEGRYIWVTGLISMYEGKPELAVKRQSQIHLY